MFCPLCHTDNPDGATLCHACGVALDSQGDAAEEVLPVGATLQHGPFVINRVLGQGGFGITYLSSDIHLNRPVAIKEFFPSGCYRKGASIQPSGAIARTEFQEAKQRFLEEARTLARFRHPGIVDVFAAFEENGTAYMVMEYLLGKTLGDVVREQGPLKEADALRTIREVGGALEVVHGAGMLHRDIKPENLMLCHDGRIVLIDFGTARDFSMDRTQGHTVVVTPGYAPLEQYARLAQRGVFSDVYALAATLFFLLTGTAPVPATDRAAGVEFVPPHQLAPSVSRGVSETVRWAMELKVEQRPQSVREFIRELSAPGSTRARSTAQDSAPRIYAAPSHEPAQSAIEAWRYGKQAVAATHPNDTSLSDVVDHMRAHREATRAAIQPVAEVVHLPAAVEEKEEALAPVQVISPEANSLAKELKWPNQCPCCGGVPNTTLPLTFKPQGATFKGTRVWNIPYCTACIHHIRWSDKPKPDLTVVPAGLCLTFFPAWLANYFTRDGYLLLQIWSALSAMAVCAWLLLIYALRLRSMYGRSTAACSTDTIAVACTDAHATPEGGTVHTFEFKDPAYHRAFVRLNSEPAPQAPRLN